VRCSSIQARALPSQPTTPSHRHRIRHSHFFKNKSWFFEIQILAILSAKVDKLNIDLPDAARQKMTENADKYQVERAQGSNRKYADL
jgi:hypothetical protein